MKVNASRFGFGEIDLNDRNNQFDTESLQSVFQTITDNPRTKIKKIPVTDHGHPIGDDYQFSIDGLSKVFNLVIIGHCVNGSDGGPEEHYVEDFVKAACSHLNVPLPNAKSNQFSSSAVFVGGIVLSTQPTASALFFVSTLLSLDHQKNKSQLNNIETEKNDNNCSETQISNQFQNPIGIIMYTAGMGLLALNPVGGTLFLGSLIFESTYANKYPINKLSNQLKKWGFYGKSEANQRNFASNETEKSFLAK